MKLILFGLYNMQFLNYSKFKTMIINDITQLECIIKREGNRYENRFRWNLAHDRENLFFSGWPIDLQIAWTDPRLGSRSLPLGCRQSVTQTRKLVPFIITVKQRYYFNLILILLFPLSSATILSESAKSHDEVSHWSQI